MGPIPITMDTMVTGHGIDKMSYIHAQQLEKSYESGRGRVAALQGLNFSIERGEFVAIVGPSGCGKSSLLHLIAGLDRADRGDLSVGTHHLTDMKDPELALFRRHEVGIIFQFFNLFSSLSVLENVLLPALIRGDEPKKSRERAIELLQRVGLRAAQDQRANELSGGEMQRVALCRALLHRPPLLLADEPTGNLDSSNRETIYSMLREIHREEQTTLILVSHEAEVSRLADRTLSMSDGELS